MKQCYVYRIINLINGKMYVGSRTGKINDYYLGSGTLIRKAVKKYGRHSFKKEILEIVNNPSDLLIREEHWLKSLKCGSNKMYYNLTENAGGGNIISLMTKSEKLMNSRLHSRLSKKFWASLTPQQKNIQRKKISDGQKGRIVSKHTRGCIAKSVSKYYKSLSLKLRNKRAKKIGKTISQTRWCNDGVRNYRRNIEQIKAKNLKLGFIN